ncbi:MAG TPA: TonB-dependent receptor, partial [Rhodospirillaceae bacterium]|nr:TonB-dependent receptor [Rhodospirillaceae bacterium]
VINWRTAYQLQNISISAGIDNLLNRQYYDPNGGAYVSGWRAMGGMGAMPPLPAPGRSYNAGVTVKF